MSCDEERRFSGVDAWVACMRRADFAGAWAVSDLRRTAITEAEWRKPRHLQRIWDGSEVSGRRVLVRCYHGLGDTIQFARFLPALRARAAQVIVWAQPAVLPLLATCGGIDRLIPLHDGRPDVVYDVDVEIMELAYLLRVTCDTLASRIPYLHLPPLTRTGSCPRPRVAIAWRTGTWDVRRSVSLDATATMFADVVEPDVLLPSLTAAEAAVFPPPPHRNSLLDVARRIAAADLTVSADTVYAHIAGALGRPVWVLLPVDADWRWMEDRGDSPWYPTARLFRQPARGDWAAVATQVRSALRTVREATDAERHTACRVNGRVPESTARRPGGPYRSRG